MYCDIIYSHILPANNKITFKSIAMSVYGFHKNILISMLSFIFINTKANGRGNCYCKLAIFSYQEQISDASYMKFLSGERHKVSLMFGQHFTAPRRCLNQSWHRSMSPYGVPSGECHKGSLMTSQHLTASPRQCLNQCWLRSMLPYGIIWLQWVKDRLWIAWNDGQSRAVRNGTYLTETECRIYASTK